MCSSWHWCVHTPAATTARAVPFALEILVEESPESRVGLGEETQKGTRTAEQAEPAAEPGNCSPEWISALQRPEKALTILEQRWLEGRVSRKECLSCCHQGAVELHQWEVGFYAHP